jgi:hypothetical protein
VNSATKKSYSVLSKWTVIKDATYAENSMSMLVVNAVAAIDCKDIDKTKFQTDLKDLWDKQTGQLDPNIPLINHVRYSREFEQTLSPQHL